jgi:hypothetical protein
MKRTLSLLAVVALLSVPAVAWAQTKKTLPPAPGQSEYAPGQRADDPGEAKKYAPGQRMKKKDDPRSPGASEYAPGQQPNPKKKL